ncbi:MAG: Mth938-like domain-containing protein [Hyphomicrobiaceae bacterium]
MPEATGFFPGRAAIEAYGNGGFRFAGMSHRGSIVCLPAGIAAWPVTAPDQIDRASLAAVLARPQGLDFLLLGTGQSQVFPAPDVRKAFREAGIGLDVMDTGAACRTYNILLGERRPVGAALIAID